MKKIVFAILFLIIIGGVFVSLSINKSLNEIEEVTLENIDFSKLKDGVYEGSYETALISVAVEVTVEDKKIKKIDILEHKEGKGKPAEKIINLIIKEQSLDVDNISGATYSSKVIKKAIERALLRE
ncbi:FMN-binding protein [Thermohalobacter berrensis]|uniref:FMN-binding domain-containing protein n=1 Tax=Thermohalobacter berrensis TaxID=99594 RepID=A0A419SZC3_9FIRM|nr:FMN-binding protein [Thermohalobacter berrensis]RKD30509.1 hypothetical protein BET03_04005 [Thermohalobacter berrensis]